MKKGKIVGKCINCNGQLIAVTKMRSLNGFLGRRWWLATCRQCGECIIFPEEDKWIIKKKQPSATISVGSAG